MHLIKTAKIAGATWKFKWSEIDREDEAEGECFFDSKTIQITPKCVHSENFMDTIIHETLHAASGPFLTEEQVCHLAQAVAGVLWKVGYRA